MGNLKANADDWMFGTGLVYGQGLGEESEGLKHMRIDLYAVNKHYPSWTAKIGYGKHESVPVDENPYAPVVNEFTPQADIVIVGIGYNLLAYNGLFLDTGLVYNQIVSQTNYDGVKLTEYDDGGYRKAEKLELLSSAGAEVGFGYSFDSFTIRTDLTFTSYAFDLTEALYDSNDNKVEPSSTGKYGFIYLTMGLAYWF